MEKFYIFLDIDGVLYDWVFIKNETMQGRRKMGGLIRHFNPQSIYALNYLTTELNKLYDVNLVISSTWRLDMGYTINVLQNNGLNYSKEFFATPISDAPNKRGAEILQFLKDKPNANNFVIIDDEMFDFKESFPSTKIIKTNMQNNSLNLEHVKNFLNNLNLQK